MKKLIIIIFVLIFSSSALAISEYEQRNLSEIRQLLREHSWDKAKIKLLKFKDEAISSYAIALVYYNLGQIALHQKLSIEAFEHLHSAYQQNSFPAQQQTALSKTLAQLALQNNKPNSALIFIQHWLEGKPETIISNDYLFIAQVYAQTQQWSQCRQYIGQAISTHQSRVPLSWLKIHVVALLHLKEWDKSIEVLHNLLALYPKEPEQWRRLVAVYLQQSQQDKALAVQRIAVDNGQLNQTNDFRLLAKLYLTNDQPVMAAKLLNNLVEEDLLSPNRENLKLLASSWMQAKESTSAITSLTHLNNVEKNLKNSLLIANIQIKNMEWENAHLTLSKAVYEHGHHGELEFLLGLTDFYLLKIKSAKQHFNSAKNHVNHEQEATSWLSFLEKIN